jgi:hypothetical protein
MEIPALDDPPGLIKGPIHEGAATTPYWIDVYELKPSHQ